MKIVPATKIQNGEQLMMPITKVTRKKVTTLQNNQEKIANQNTTKSSEMNIASDQTIIS